MVALATLPADAEALLATFAAELTEAGIAVPARQYLNPGSLVAWDEPQFTIAVLRIFPGQPGKAVSQPVLPGAIQRSVSFGILLLVEVPALNAQGDLPATSDLDTSGQFIAQLAADFWTVAVELWTEGKFAPLNADVLLGDVTPVGPQGGLAGVSIEIQMSLL
jgi:hypothetical protein